jgi:hypothetical protein
MARHSSSSASALRLAGGWIAILIGDTAILFTGITVIPVRLIGSMSRHIRGTIIRRPCGIPTIILVPLGYIHGDRGYAVPHNQPVTAPVGRPGFDSPAPAVRPNESATRTSMPVARPTACVNGSGRRSGIHRPGVPFGTAGRGRKPDYSKLRTKQRADPSRKAHGQSTPKGYAHNRFQHGRTAGPGCKGAKQREKGQ